MQDYMNDFREQFGRLFRSDNESGSTLYGPLICWNERFGNNTSNVTGNNGTNCSLSDGNLHVILDGEIPHNTNTANHFFTYVTPVILIVGMIGNLLSLIVFVSKNMRKLSASLYLAALSSSDILALLLYVLPEWLKYGLTSFSDHYAVEFHQYNGVCQIMLYLQYIARFLSSWFVVFFTIERFIGVCFPLRRRHICNRKSASKVILVTIIFAAVGCAFKPFLSRSYVLRNGRPLCTSDRGSQYISFILDSVFGVTITFIPFVIITVLNLLIIRQLVLQNRRSRKIRVVTEESVIRLEFTFILLAVSICFVGLNLPYFAVWCKKYWSIKQMFNVHEYTPGALQRQDDHLGNLDEILHVTRTIFYVNYCINFFLYAVTGAFFRQELKQVFSRRDSRQNSYKNNAKCCTRTNSRTTPNSWV
ncbi:cysteinyl leukotriene receptor 2-like [Mya arenaria]|uniref:cysteinyl leukotriene receptor 2-like n=1 Tax=Mya arenaria TaxID=6604 RepID=UPI0022E029E7|nr:cysteinyl leukotriene receptor 2-like [Mya arenaria]XP_052765176.1 cysteinyl leukotriene receptor 2-like [Mya arenaria]XP_052765177.1 cysteinyl leukotriene receptor 2-like [Mya arenaria]XP_052765178.1 cysteinyl leukotriene receptor 2-like [Mya arenaria]